MHLLQYLSRVFLRPAGNDMRLRPIISAYYKIIIHTCWTNSEFPRDIVFIAYVTLIKNKLAVAADPILLRNVIIARVSEYNFVTHSFYLPSYLFFQVKVYDLWSFCLLSYGERGFGGYKYPEGVSHENPTHSVPQSWHTVVVDFEFELLMLVATQ